MFRGSSSPACLTPSSMRSKLIHITSRHYYAVEISFITFSLSTHISKMERSWPASKLGRKSDDSVQVSDPWLDCGSTYVAFPFSETCRILCTFYFCFGAIPRAHHRPPGDGERLACLPVLRYEIELGAQKALKGLMRPLRAL